MGERQKLLCKQGWEEGEKSDIGGSAKLYQIESRPRGLKLYYYTFTRFVTFFFPFEKELRESTLLYKI